MEFQGCALLRYRVVASLLMGTPIKICKIRSKSDYPGLTDSEVKYLELIAKLTSGSEININDTGTVLKFSPGIIVNNPNSVPIEFDCGKGASLGFFIEGILPIVIFGKNKLHLVLKGLSHTADDIGIDVIQYVQIPLLKKFGVEDVNIKILCRGDEGEVVLKVTPIKNLNGVDLQDPGKIKKVRGVAFTSRLNVQMGNRASYSAKGHLHSFLPDIWIHTDHYKFGEALLGITLVAESNTGSFISSEYLRGEASQFDYLESDVPEDLGSLAVIHLLDEITYGGFVDSQNQCLPLLLMALAREKSSLRLGRLSSQAVEVLRLIQFMINITFSFTESDNPKYTQLPENEEEEEALANEPDNSDLPKNIIATCIGLGYQNMARIAF
ncbi:hypothetical protein SteCoe_16033 [Stentor coeruleus]|uniref:RNA 3'-terminal phosphate cyclase domain-containing protein n=1 Tax=Stentor coeruleus TaxID=5963 RepID=A0A1R2C248_9CILI|nr:hypothetical protein SteCoe_16033 [Stentor coeruleus]